MTVEILRDVLLSSAVINYGILLLWFVVFRFAHDWIYRLHGRWFRMSVEQFDAAHYSAMAIYKIATLLFGITPYIALHIVG